MEILNFLKGLIWWSKRIIKALDIILICMKFHQSTQRLLKITLTIKC